MCCVCRLAEHAGVWALSETSVSRRECVAWKEMLAEGEAVDLSFVCGLAQIRPVALVTPTRTGNLVPNHNTFRSAVSCSACPVSVSSHFQLLPQVFVPLSISFPAVTHFFRLLSVSRPPNFDSFFRDVAHAPTSSIRSLNVWPVSSAIVTHHPSSNPTCLAPSQSQPRNLGGATCFLCPWPQLRCRPLRMAWCVGAADQRVVRAHRLLLAGSSPMMRRVLKGPLGQVTTALHVQSSPGQTQVGGGGWSRSCFGGG